MQTMSRLYNMFLFRFWEISSCCKVPDFHQNWVPMLIKELYMLNSSKKHLYVFLKLNNYMINLRKSCSLLYTLNCENWLRFTKGNGNLVRVCGVSSYPGFELTGLYCMVFLQISVKLSPWRDIFQNWTSPCQGVSWSSHSAMSVDQSMVENVGALEWKKIIPKCLAEELPDWTTYFVICFQKNSMSPRSIKLWSKSHSTFDYQRQHQAAKSPKTPVHHSQNE